MANGIKHDRFCNLAAGEHFYMAKPDEDWKPRTSILYVKLPINPLANGNARIVATNIVHPNNVGEKVVINADAPVCTESEWTRIKEEWKRNKQRRQHITH